MARVEVTLITLSESFVTPIVPRYPSWSLRLVQQPASAVSAWVATSAYYVTQNNSRTGGTFRPPGWMEPYGSDSPNQLAPYFYAEYSAGTPIAYAYLPTGGGTATFAQIEQCQN